MDKFLVLLLVISFVLGVNYFVIASDNSDLVGKWEGEIDISGQKLGVIIKINQNKEELTGSLDIPAQGAIGISLGKIELNEDKVIFTVPQLQGNVKFKGMLKNNKITGKFEQSGYKFPFELNKVADKADDKKEKNYALGEYNVKEMEMKVPVEGGKLAGTLAVPESLDDKSPVVILVAGSGPTDRDGNNPILRSEINTLKEIAHYLTSNGVITFRYDKRGIKGSSELMKEEPDSFLSYRNDLIAVVDYIINHDQIKKDEIYILGHSEGSMLSIMAAEKGAEVDGLILVSGSGYTHGQTLRTQISVSAEQYEKAGYSGVKEEMLKALDDLYESVRTDSSFDISEYNIPEEMKTIYLSIANQPQFAKDWLEVDPVTLLEKVNKPVCIIQGSADGRVGIEDARKLASAVPDDRLELHILEGVNHYLKKAETGNPVPTERIDQNLLNIINKFVN